MMLFRVVHGSWSIDRSMVDIDADAMAMYGQWQVVAGGGVVENRQAASQSRDER